MLNGLLLFTLPAVTIAGLPLALRKVPPNGLYGYRTPAVLKSARLWYPVNQFFGCALLVAGGASAVLGVRAVARHASAAGGRVILAQVALVIAAFLVTWCYSLLIPADAAESREALAPADHPLVSKVLRWLVPLSSIALAIPLIARAVPPNGMYGYRTAATLSSPARWYAANRVLGWAILAAGAAGLALAVSVSSRARPSIRRRVLLLDVLLLLAAALFTWSYVTLAFTSR